LPNKTVYCENKNENMEELKIGDMSPQFEGKDQDGNIIQLSSYLGKKTVLFFYPKDSTPGCTTEACNLRDNYLRLQSKGFEIIGISVDSQKSHQKFIEKNKLPYPLISDTEKEIVTKFGVWGEKKFMGRTYLGTKRVTFVLDENGIIERIFDKVDTKKHAEQILTSYK
jgi:peroxiredoxin Q/BCP